MKQRIIEVCPALSMFQYFGTDRAQVIVVVDVLRASTTICTAFDYGAEKVIPVAAVEEAVDYHNKGYFVAGERGGIKLDFADAGNSPFEMMTDEIKGKTVVLTTTNGTQAIQMACGKNLTVIGAFINLTILKNWLLQRSEDVLVLCAGWENLIGLEDVIFAGALAESLTQEVNFLMNSDETFMAYDLWQLAKYDIQAYISKFSHTKRLVSIGQDESIEYCFKIGVSGSLPYWNNGALQKFIF